MIAEDLDLIAYDLDLIAYDLDLIAEDLDLIAYVRKKKNLEKKKLDHLEKLDPQIIILIHKVQ